MVKDIYGSRLAKAIGQMGFGAFRFNGSGAQQDNVDGYRSAKMAAELARQLLTQHDNALTPEGLQALR